MTCERCESPMRRALRYGPTPEPVPVHLCLNCGNETPPLGRCCTTQQSDPSTVCDQCDGTLTRRQVINRQRFCSHECYANNKRMTVDRRECPCGVVFWVLAYQVRAHRGVYHDRACYERIGRGMRRAS